MFIQSHDPDYVPKPMYPEYIPLKDKHVLLAEEQPLPPVVSPTTELPGDNADDEDADEEDKKEEEKHLALTDSVVVVPTVELVSPPKGIEPVIPPPSIDITTIGARITIQLQASISLPQEAEVERLLAMPTPPPSPLTSLSPPSTEERLARCTILFAHLSPPPVPSLLLPSFGYPTKIQTLRIASTQALIDAVAAALPSPSLPPLPPPLYIPPPVDRRDDIHKTKLQPRKKLCLFALGPRYEVGESSTARPRSRDRLWAVHYELQTHRKEVYAHESQIQAHQTQLQMHGTLIQTQHQAEVLALREQQRRARQPRSDARVPDHQDASRDVDSHI
nr:hypothetical protein [Tanacetum cinerariifolium]